MAVIPFFKEKPCSVRQRLAKVTFLAMLPDGSRTKIFYENIPDDRWNIISFDAATRNVCVRHTTLHGSENLSASTLPHLAPTNQEEFDTTQTNTPGALLSPAFNQPRDVFQGVELPAF